MTNFMESAFDRDLYFGSHPRNLFFASRWLSHLLEEDYDWPMAAAEIATFLRANNCSADHTKAEVERARELLAPWLLLNRPTVPKEPPSHENKYDPEEAA
ncbi:MAG: hypothetical protein HKN36_05055 [Hellea sp.]|nr:hypothetical protein [Hellea sp.]